MKTFRYIVQGHVQGVAFRFHTILAAEKLGISGTVRNRPDGHVEVYAQGTPEALAVFVSFLQRGPSRASVERVICEDAGDREPFADFRATF
jgi:acylphosphatase